MESAQHQLLMTFASARASPFQAARSRWRSSGAGTPSAVTTRALAERGPRVSARSDGACREGLCQVR